MANNWFSRQLGTQAPQQPRVQQPPAAQPEHISPDGKWKWNGAEWVPNKPNAPLMPPPPPEDLPRHAMQAKMRQATAACPMCGIDDTFVPQPPTDLSAPRRCFSCGFNERKSNGSAVVNSTAFDFTSGGINNQSAQPARGQSGGNWQGPKNTAPPPQTREYM